MFRCDFCEKEFQSLGSYAGHRSGHVRRGEIEKGLNVRDPLRRHICKICDKEFEDGFKLGGHMHKHNISFDELKCYGSKKVRLLEECGHRCENCKNTEWMGKPIPLEIDHIDGNSSNNAKENLQLICPNCHAQTPTYRGKNIGNNPDPKRAETLKKHYGKYRT